MKTLILKDNIREAAGILQGGGLVAVPTETVYGLAGNGLDENAVEKIYEVKGRPSVKPLSLMVHDESAMDALCLDVPEQAKLLAGRFWPGPLTIVLKARDMIPSVVLAGGDTVGLRCPDHPMTLELLRCCSLPLAAPSANPSGAESPKTAQKVLEYFDGRIDAVIDGGPCGIGTESTILDMSARPFRILRQGALAAEAIADALVDGMTIIGITGGTGCGKTTALMELQSLGAMILDCDAIYHELLESSRELLAEIDANYPGVVRDGKLERKALGAVVFRDADALQRLNRITHSHVDREVTRRLREHAMAGGTLAAIDAIELISSGISRRCDKTVAVVADEERRIERIMARDNIDRAYAEMRVRAQRPASYFEENCEHVLWNNADQASFRKICRQLFKEITAHG